MSENDNGKGWATGTITCKNADDEEATISYDFGNTLDEMVVKYGADVVFYNASKRLATGMRNKLYGLLTTGDEPSTVEEALVEMAEWVPTVAAGRAKKSPAEAALAALEKMTPEAKATFLEELTASLTE